MSPQPPLWVGGGGSSSLNKKKLNGRGAPNLRKFLCQTEQGLEYVNRVFVNINNNNNERPKS